MADTSIEWTEKSWNPVTGCTKVSAGCKNCYAETVALRFWPSQYPPVKYVTCSGAAGCDHQSGCQPFDEDRPRVFTDVQTHADRLDQPLRWKKPRRVFVNSMSDLFHEDVPDAFIDQVFAVMAMAPQHTFQVLTKRAARMRAYLSVDKAVILDRLDAASDNWTHGLCADVWPLPNVWLGVSVENQHFAGERIPLLLQTPAAVRFISAEPLLGPVKLDHMDVEAGAGRSGYYCINALTGRNRDMGRPCPDVPHLDWVIVGGESGPGARRFDCSWARSIVTQCHEADVPCFVKQLGARPHIRYDGVTPTALKLRDRKGGDMAEWPDDLCVREFPEAVHG